MLIVTVPLKDGQSAQAHSRPSVNQMKRLFRARRDMAEEDLMVEFALIFCTEWDVRGEDGTALPLSKAGVDAAPFDVLIDLTEKVSEFLDTEEPEPGKG